MHEICLLEADHEAGVVRRRKSVDASTMADALEEWKKFRLEVESGRRAYGSCKTLEEYVTRFCHLRKPRIAAKTYTSDKTALKRILPILGNHRMDRINAALVRDLVAEMKSKRYEPETINKTLRVLRKVLRDAVDREELPVYPIKGKLPLQKVTPLRLELAPEETAAFLRAFDDLEAFRKHQEKERAPGEVVTSPLFRGETKSVRGRTPP